MNKVKGLAAVAAISAAMVISGAGIAQAAPVATGKDDDAKIEQNTVGLFPTNCSDFTLIQILSLDETEHCTKEEDYKVHYEDNDSYRKDVRDNSRDSRNEENTYVEDEAEDEDEDEAEKEREVEVEVEAEAETEREKQDDAK